MCACELRSKMSSRDSQESGSRQITDQEKQELTDVLTRAGLLHLKDTFLREKVFVHVHLHAFSMYSDYHGFR